VPDRLAAVTVLHPECMLADVWATALGVLGPEEGLELATRQGLAALFLLRDGGGIVERFSPALAAMLDEDDV
jgi:thiamine biosynthesis lipoprotein